MSIEVERPLARPSERTRSCATSRCASRRASWSRCSARPAAARPRSCGSSPGWRCPTRARCGTTARTSRPAAPASGTWGVVFQHYALFRHMTVAENVAFALRRCASARAPRSVTRVDELLGLVQLAGLPRPLPAAALRRPAAAGGAGARARHLAAQVLLLDEPFGALDARVRQELRRWLRRLHDELHVTSVFVTHDQEEAFEVSDRVVLMNAGRIEQVGTPAQVFEEPASPFVMRFLGAVNVFHGRVEGDRAFVNGVELAAPARRSSRAPAHVYVRPHELEVHRAAGAGQLRRARGAARAARRRGPRRADRARARRRGRGGARRPAERGPGARAGRRRCTCRRGGCGSSRPTRRRTASPPAGCEGRAAGSAEAGSRQGAAGHISLREKCLGRRSEPAAAQPLAEAPAVPDCTIAGGRASGSSGMAIQSAT